MSKLILVFNHPNGAMEMRWTQYGPFTPGKPTVCAPHVFAGLKNEPGFTHGKECECPDCSATRAEANQAVQDETVAADLRKAKDDLAKFGQVDTGALARAEARVAHENDPPVEANENEEAIQ